MTIITTYDLGDGSATAETVAGQTMTVFDGGTGPAGPGVAVGGSAGQVLAKASTTDFDTEWVDAATGGGAVDSVNGHTGVVVLTASDVGADASGAAASALTTAEGYTDAAVSGEVTRANAAYDAAGAATTALTTAEAYTDTAISGEVTRANAAYDAAGAAASAQAAAISAAATDATSKVAAEATARTAAIATQHTADVAAFDAAGAAATAQAAAATDATTKANAAQAFAIQRGNHTGTQSADTLTDGTTNKAFLATERTKLSGIAAGATANSSDATLLARANHTGTESADVLTDGTTNKAFLATERTKLTGIATGATANDTDANLKNRANHTGTQTLSTISDAGTAAAVNTGTTSGTVPLLSTGGVLPIARLATGTPDGTKFVRDDGTLAAPSGSDTTRMKYLNDWLGTSNYAVNDVVRYGNKLWACTAAVTGTAVTASFVGSATNKATTAATFTLAIPGTAVAGDLALIAVSSNTIVAPSYATAITSGIANTTWRTALYSYTLTAADITATTLTIPVQGSAGATGTLHVFRNTAVSGTPVRTTTLATGSLTPPTGAAFVYDVATTAVSSGTAVYSQANLSGVVTSSDANSSSTVIGAGYETATAGVATTARTWGITNEFGGGSDRQTFSVALITAGTTPFPTGSFDLLARSIDDAVNTVAASGSAQTIPDTAVDTVNLITMTAACTFTFPQAIAGKRFRLALKQDGTGSRTATWPAAVKWSGGSAPTLTTTAAKTDHFEFTCYDGISWLGQTLGLNY